jgi:hypothetical protein
VRNKYEKGDIQCADNQQNQPQQQQQQQQQQQPQPQHDDQGEKTDSSSQGTALHLRRKRRKISESPVSVMCKFSSNLGKKNVVIQVTMLQLDDLGVKSCQGQESFIFVQTSIPAQSLAQLDMHWVPLILSQGKVVGA